MDYDEDRVQTVKDALKEYVRRLQDQYGVTIDGDLTISDDDDEHEFTL